MDKHSSESDNDTLLASLREGNTEAFQYILEEYGPRLLATAQRIVIDSDMAQDCLQEAMINAFQKIDSFEERSSLYTWLHRIVVNAALSSRRAKVRKQEIGLDAVEERFDSSDCRIESLHSRMPPVDELLQREEIRAYVRQNIDALPETHRNVLLLRDIEEMGIAEVAALLKISESAAKVRVHRARAALKKRLQTRLTKEQS